MGSPLIVSVDDETFEFPEPLESRIRALSGDAGAVLDLLDAHIEDTTNVHGIPDTATLQQGGVSPLQWYRNGKV